MPKTAYLYDEITGAFIDDFLVEESPEFTYPGTFLPDRRQRRAMHTSNPKQRPVRLR